MRQLLEDYRRRLKTLNGLLTEAINTADDLEKITRLTIKRSCYRTFISELERIVPDEKEEIVVEETRPFYINEKGEKKYYNPQIYEEAMEARKYIEPEPFDAKWLHTEEDESK